MGNILSKRNDTPWLPFLPTHNAGREDDPVFLRAPRRSATILRTVNCPHRLEDQDTGLSSLVQGFESPWGHYTARRALLPRLYLFVCRFVSVMLPECRDTFMLLLLPRFAFLTQTQKR